MSKVNSPSSILEPTDFGAEQSDGSGKSPGEALAKFDFSHTDFSHTDLGSTDVGHQGPDVTDTHAALASMSSADALDYAISQMDLADHPDAEHLDVPGDTSHDT